VLGGNQYHLKETHPQAPTQLSAAQTQHRLLVSVTIGVVITNATDFNSPLQPLHTVCTTCSLLLFTEPARQEEDAACCLLLPDFFSGKNQTEKTGKSMMQKDYKSRKDYSITSNQSKKDVPLICPERMLN
jgi:hypothetical protein